MAEAEEYENRVVAYGDVLLLGGVKRVRRASMTRKQ